MHKDVKEILFDEDKIKSRVLELAKKITEDYHDEELVFVCILKGSFMFFADLVRAVELDSVMDFITVQSYGNSTTSGELTLVKDVSADINNKNVIIVEDILDTGKTLTFLKKHLEKKNPKSVKIVTLLEKTGRKETDVQAEYVGFNVDDVFVVGYGLDYAQKYRHLPYIGILKEEVWK